MTRIKAGLLALGIGGALTTAIAPSATAAEHSGGPACVTRHQYLHDFPNVDPTRAKIENRWGVRGYGHRIGKTDPMPEAYRQNVQPHSIVIQYRLCGHGLRHGGVFVYYDKAQPNMFNFAAMWTGRTPLVPTY